jgi:phage terminase large subunit-like protein
MVERGLLTMVDDVEISPSLIANWLKEMGMVYKIRKIAVDSYRYALLSKYLREIGFDANDGRVKMVRPSDIMLVHGKINSVFVSQKLIVGDDPMFRWYTNNSKSVPAPNNNFKYDKIEPKSRKTDGFMAFVHAMTVEEELPERREMVFLEPIIF